ncbi:MAG TPA: A/G-specific adenine glycosylase [Thermoanaerobaculia bacterium]|nr:A/G-specific adenine glycosylase [Thermoanaerobaculia bacterium]HUM28872.1 A/G-specific adenine glycosylase [Thermoanaerobaculia bacterium]HXK67195.1 A/G-specific adenine glycosylase [Thermoanaerobaculia bacterium]
MDQKRHSPHKHKTITGILLDWFRTSARDLPWRREPRNPYRVWISEIMLQQTRVATVIPYYQRWMEQFPDVQSLAEASLDQVLKAWEGLGYYRRARMIHEAAREIRLKFGGILPLTAEELKTLPGIGSYAAAAIASIVADERVIAVDGNVKRVAARLFGIEEKITSRMVEKLLIPHLPPKGSGAFNEALMELGAMICTPRSPACKSCPISRECIARTKNLVHSIPLPARAKRPPLVRAIGLVQIRKKEILLIQRPEEEMLGGLWGFPLLYDRDNLPEGSRTLPEIRHSYTHFTLAVTPCVIIEAETDGLSDRRSTERFVSLNESETMALSRLDRKILELVKTEGIIGVDKPVQR